MDTNLAQLSVGQSGRVLDLAHRGAQRRRLVDLGLLPGTLVERVLSSPIGGPGGYRIRGSLIALRDNDAKLVSVTAN